MNTQADEKLTVEAGASRLRIYSCQTMPSHWVIEDEGTGVLYIVPAGADGWSRRIPYHGHRKALTPARSFFFAGLGAPIRRPWREVTRDEDGRN